MRVLYLYVLVLLSCSVMAEPGFQNESEAGVVIANGNSKSQSYNLKQSNSYGWTQDELKIHGRYLDVSSLGITSAENWLLTVRYERIINPTWSAFIAETASGDRFAGFDQKYASDIGAKYQILKQDNVTWSVETGYRYSEEHRTDMHTHTQHIGRLYTEVTKNIGIASSGKFSLEYLPDLTLAKDFQVNSESSISSILTDILSIKITYQLKFDNVPAKAGAVKADSVFTTGLVAKL